jgi:hypothetical protein
MRWKAPLLTLAMLAVTRPVDANETDVCDAAYEAAQSMRDAKKLMAARDQLRACSSATCPAFMVKECTGWLSEVEPRIPSIVLVASDGNGAPLPNVKVAIDGATASRNVDGTAWEVDPGQHSFAFTLADGTRVDKTALVVEARKEQRITVTVATAPEHAFPYKPVGYAAGGVGVLGVVLGSIFGMEALSTKSNNCTNGLCRSGGAATAYDQGTISTVSFVVGGLFLAGGAVLLYMAPQKTSSQARALMEGRW